MKITDTIPAPSTNPAPGTSALTSDPLANLRDIQLPVEVGLWPLAPGWWILSVLILALIITLSLFWQRSRKRTLYRRLAKEELLKLQQQNDSPSLKLENMNRLLKRIAILAYPNISVAALNGKAWSDFLQQSAPAVSAPRHLHSLLNEQLYGPVAITEPEVDELAEFTRHWISKHLPETKLTVTGFSSC